MNHGLAICCNTSPEYIPRAPGARGSGFQCPVCNKHAFGWGGSKAWSASNWNQKFHTTSWDESNGFRDVVYHELPDLDVGGDWIYAKLIISSWLPWQDASRKEVPFILLRVTDDLSHLTIRSFEGKEIEIDIPQFKQNPPLFACMYKGWCTDNTYWNTLELLARNQKWIQYLETKLTELNS